jgi:hypothetical protein
VTTYGAVVGTLALVVAIAALGWQVFTWRRARTEPTVVDIGPAIVDGVAAVQIEVRSHSPLPIYAVGAALSVSGAGPGFSVIHLVPGPPGSSIPGVITPNNVGKTSVPLAQLPPIGQFGWSVRAEIWLAHRKDPIGSRRMAWVATNNGGKWEYTT